MNKNISTISLAASPLEGEMTFIQSNVLNESIMKYIKEKTGSLFKSIKDIFKDKRKMLLIIILSSIWFILMLLKALNINFILIDILSFLTFSQGGVSSNAIPVIGGLIGKAIFTFFITSLMLSKKGKQNFKEKIKSFIEVLNFKNKEFIIFSLLGVGLSLIAYNFLSGGLISNSIIGIASIIMLLRSLYSKTGIIREKFYVILSNTKIITENADINLNRVEAGCILGFMLGILFSLIGPNFCYIIGSIILVTSIILRFTIKKI